jgi:alpha-L-rhamnosidase
LSLNHIMFGEISAWMFKALGGIKAGEAQPGFKHFVVKPNFLVEDFECWHDSPFGRIVSSWKTKEGHIRYTLVIPPNTWADLNLGRYGKKIITNAGKIASKNMFRLSAGRYEFVLEM